MHYGGRVHVYVFLQGRIAGTYAPPKMTQPVEAPLLFHKVQPGDRQVNLLYNVDPMALRATCTPGTTPAVLPHSKNPVDAQTPISQYETKSDGENVRS